MASDAAALWLPALADSALRPLFGSTVLERGRLLGTAVAALRVSSDGAVQQVSATVRGGQPYRVHLQLSAGSALRGDCECRHALSGAACKHQAALALAWRQQLGEAELGIPAASELDPELLDFLRQQDAERLRERLIAWAPQQPELLAALQTWQAWSAPLTDLQDLAAARRRMAQLMRSLLPTPDSAQLLALPALLQAWRTQDPALAQAGAEQAYTLACARLAELHRDGAWADGLAAWEQLSQAIVRELLEAWAAQAPQAPAYADTYLRLQALQSGLLEPALALPRLGAGVTARAGQLLERAWAAGGPAQPYLRHLEAVGDAPERLRVLAAERRDAAGHAAYIAALLQAGRDREALGAAEAGLRAHPGDGALEALLISLYERDGWDAEALALRRAAFAREPTAARHAELLRLATDPEAERLRLDAELSRTRDGRALRLQLWAREARWHQGLAWLQGQDPMNAELLPLEAWVDWLQQLPPDRDADAAEQLKRVLQVGLRAARPPFARELRWLQAILERLTPEAGRLWLAWLRLEHRGRREFLDVLERVASRDNPGP